jgi:hypothetical protein
MTGNLEPDERVMTEPSIFEQMKSVAQKLGWDANDDIAVEVGGTVVSGIVQPEGYNKKWASPLGHRKYNKDAFIVIKNLSRNDDTKSQPMDRPHEPNHLKDLNNEKTVTNKS